MQHIREGRFQRILAVVTGFASILSGAEVAYEHYRGSYSQQVMYTPVILSLVLMVTGFAAAFSRRVARMILPVVSALVIIDGFVGFIFHVRGIARRPGGWRIPIPNMIMGPPVFAPLLFGLAGYLGLITSFLRRTGDPTLPHDVVSNMPGIEGRGLASFIPSSIGHDGIVMAHHIREGRFQQNIALIAGLSAIFSGIEASYSHYQNNFQYRKLQISPLVIAAALGVAGIGSVGSRKMARTVLPVMSLIAMADGAVGTWFHFRGILRQPGGLRKPLHNIIYGPPIFAPMLFAASGFMGVLASLLRRPQ